MLSTIKRKMRLRALKQATDNVVNTQELKDILTNYLVWADLIPDYLEEVKLYSTRHQFKFNNIQELQIAIEITHGNIINNRSAPYSNRPTYLLLDDWLVDGESYRYRLLDFIKTTKRTLTEINRALDNCSYSGFNYHIYNCAEILVTLQEIVKICHYSNL